MAKKFEIQKQGFPSVADAYNGLLGMDNNRVVNLPISQLDEIDNQPFPINESKVDQIADSIDAVGVLEHSARLRYPVLLKTTLLTIRQQDLSCLQQIPTETMSMLRQFMQEPMQNSLNC